jgi:hypothetical protein
MNRLSRTELQTITKECFEGRVQAATQKIYTEILNTAKQGKDRYKIHLDESDSDIISAVFCELVKLFPEVLLLCDWKTEITASWM